MGGSIDHIGKAQFSRTNINSPLRILLHFVDANVRWATAEEDPGEDLATGPTLLHLLSHEADPYDHSVHRNQVILGQQLFRHGANPNLGTLSNGYSPLYIACKSGVVTNLDFIQLLLENGASPNAQDVIGWTPVMNAVTMSPGAAKFLLEWSTPPTTDIHITSRTGMTLLDVVRFRINSTIDDYPDETTSPENPEQRVKGAFLLQQWREIETMLVERGL
jgi:hypothetical protein